MDFLGIGIPEVILILVIMLVVLGPKDMVKTGRQVGRLIRKVITSPAWTSMMTASREIREFPTRLVRDAGIEEDIEEIRKQTQVSVSIEDPRTIHPRPNSLGSNNPGTNTSGAVTPETITPGTIHPGGNDHNTSLPASPSPETPHLPPVMQENPPEGDQPAPQDPVVKSEPPIDPQI
jgi:Sec-independent protein translocase protein TatA